MAMEKIKIIFIEAGKEKEVEALVGLILITWSASFLFIEMGKYWRVKKK